MKTPVDQDREALIHLQIVAIENVLSAIRPSGGASKPDLQSSKAAQPFANEDAYKVLSDPAQASKVAALTAKYVQEYQVACNSCEQQACIQGPGCILSKISTDEHDQGLADFVKRCVRYSYGEMTESQWEQLLEHLGANQQFLSQVMIDDRTCVFSVGLLPDQVWPHVNDVRQPTNRAEQ